MLNIFDFSIIVQMEKEPSHRGVIAPNADISGSRITSDVTRRGEEMLRSNREFSDSNGLKISATPLSSSRVVVIISMVPNFLFYALMLLCKFFFLIVESCFTKGALLWRTAASWNDL